jgi:Secretion system C-terminal sorting domain
MRKIFTFLFASALTLTGIAQLKPKPASPVMKESIKIPYNSPLVAPSNQKTQPDDAGNIAPKLPSQAQLKSMTYWEQVIGFSSYDNQTNNSIQDRIVSDGTNLSATWTYSSEENATWSDRGTGNNSANDGQWGTEPYERIESFRTGFPSSLVAGNGNEKVFCHSGTGGITQLTRDVVGQGTWTSTTVPTSLGADLFWPKAAVDGNTIHLIAITESEAQGGILVNGINMNMVYFRSEDNGLTWNIVDHYFPEITADEFEFLSGDAYAIHARDGQVSIGIFLEFSDTVLMHSSDSGSNWAMTVISDFAIDGYTYDSLSDSNNDGIVDTLFTTDGTGAIHIDGDGTTHVFFGSSFIMDDTPGDTLYSYFNTYDLLYWNDTYATDSIYVIASAQESANDNDAVITLTLAQIPRYGSSLCSMPSVGEDASGNLYLVYAAADEEYIDQQIFRHIFAMSSADNGVTWTTPAELTPDLEGEGLEYVFPSLCRTIDDKLHIVLMRDNEPGLNVRGDLDPIQTVDIVYLGITTDLDVTASVAAVPTSNVELLVYPNPTSGQITLSGNNLTKQPLCVTNVAGQVVVNTRLNNASESKSYPLDFSFLPDGMYNLQIGIGKTAVTKSFIIEH